MSVYEAVGLALVAFAFGHLPGHALGYWRGQRSRVRRTYVGPTK